MRIVNIVILCFVFFLSFVVLPSIGNAATYIYVIGNDGKVHKISTESDNIVKQINLEKINNLQNATLDNSKGLLYLVHGKLTPGISVFELPSLSPLNDFDIVSGSPDARVFAPLNNNNVYVDWFDDEKGSRVFTKFLNSDFTKEKDIIPYPIITNRSMYSKDNKKVYSIKMGREVGVYVYSLPDFQFAESIPLKNIFTNGIFGRTVDDYQNEILLIDENWKKSRAEPDTSTLYTYNISTGISSKKIILSKDGYGKLTSDGTNIIFDEQKDVMVYGDYELQSVGTIYVYDVANGSLLGSVKYSDKSGDYFMLVHPNGKKVYMSDGDLNSEKLIVVDIENFKVTKTINVPSGAMFFADEK